MDQEIRASSERAECYNGRKNRQSHLCRAGFLPKSVKYRNKQFIVQKKSNAFITSKNASGERRHLIVFLYIYSYIWNIYIIPIITRASKIEGLLKIKNAHAKNNNFSSILLNTLNFIKLWFFSEKTGLINIRNIHANKQILQLWYWIPCGGSETPCNIARYYLMIVHCMISVLFLVYKLAYFGIHLTNTVPVFSAWKCPSSDKICALSQNVHFACKFFKYILWGNCVWWNYCEVEWSNNVWVCCNDWWVFASIGGGRRGRGGGWE